MNPRRQALELLCLQDPHDKANAARALWPLTPNVDGDLQNPLTAQHTEEQFNPRQPLPGRPTRPHLVATHQVPKRSPFTVAGRAALLHAVAHIELNAINLALDAVWRFAGMPAAYYRDWLQVASEEALHFSLLDEHLATLGHAYGDFDAHDGLWTMVEKTADDVTARMALVPRTLEARGLDATPPMQARLAQAGDTRAVEILALILRDEVGHVAIGNHWYRWLCARDGLDPVEHYALLAQRHGAPRPRGPFNLDARRAAGFSELELAELTGVTQVIQTQGPASACPKQ